MESASLMEMLTTPTTFPTNVDWEGKMEPSSPLDSQHGFAEDIFDDSYDYCNDQLFNNEVYEIEEDLKPDPSILALLNKHILEIPIEVLREDLCYDDKLKISSNDESAQLIDYGPENEFYDFPQQPESKTAGCTNGSELLMEFECVPGNTELMNHLTPPQTPPQSSSFGGVVGCVLPLQMPMNSVTIPQQQQQQQSVEQFQPLYVQQSNQQGLVQQEQQVSFQGTNDNSLNGYYIMGEFSTAPQQQQSVSMEPLQEVPGDIETTLFNFGENYTPQQMSEMEKIVLSLQRETYHGGDDDESCDSSEIGSIENGGSMSPASLTSSLVAQSPTYSDSAESSAYYGSSRNDGDDEDWSPLKAKKLNGRNGGAVTKKRTGPNGSTNSRGRGIEEKKSRKKEQNKNAATRYRQKKKAEIEEILTVENVLRERNEKLKSESKELGRDIRCIKNLLRELLRSKI